MHTQKTRILHQIRAFARIELGRCLKNVMVLTVRTRQCRVSTSRFLLREKRGDCSYPLLRATPARVEEPALSTLRRATYGQPHLGGGVLLGGGGFVVAGDIPG